MNRAFIRCNEGHYFEGQHCFFDGWSSKESEQFWRISEEIRSENQPISLELFRQKGADHQTIKRMIVIDFGDGNFVFEAISPDGFVVDGRYIRLNALPAEMI